MNPYVTWAAAVACLVSGLLSTWVLQHRPVWARRAAMVMAGSGVVLLANEALRMEATAYIGICVAIVGSTFVNWMVCRQAERELHRRAIETLELLAELHRERQRSEIDRAAQRTRGESTGIWPPKEC